MANTNIQVNGMPLMDAIKELSERWEILRDMERLKFKARGQDLAKAFERVGLPVVWAWATHCNFPRMILRVLCGYFEHQWRVQFE